MEKEITKNRQATEMTLITAVNDIIEESGFEGLGINAVAAKAKVSKMLIYRYFNSLDGLIEPTFSRTTIGLISMKSYRIRLI